MFCIKMNMFIWSFVYVCVTQHSVNEFVCSGITSGKYKSAILRFASTAFAHLPHYSHKKTIQNLIYYFVRIVAVSYFDFRSQYKHTHTLVFSTYAIESKSTFTSPIVCCSVLICDALKPSTSAKLSTSAH